MITTDALARAATAVSALMTDNRDYLVSLDQVNGDGDLGISMDDGFRAVAAFLDTCEDSDLGQALRSAARVLNEAAPSSLGTILSFGLMGMARSLKGKEEAGPEEVVEALEAGLDHLMDRAGSKPGEKTIVDALAPAVAALRPVEDARGASPATTDPAELAARAVSAAAEGSRATRDMEAVHGRAAHHAQRSVGVLDGGSVVGRLIVEAIASQVLP